MSAEADRRRKLLEAFHLFGCLDGGHNICAAVAKRALRLAAENPANPDNPVLLRHPLDRP